MIILNFYKSVPRNYISKFPTFQPDSGHTQGKSNNSIIVDTYYLKMGIQGNPQGNKNSELFPDSFR